MKWGSNRTNNIDGAEGVRVSHNAIFVTRTLLATIALLCKQTLENFRARPPPEHSMAPSIGYYLFLIGSTCTQKPLRSLYWLNTCRHTHLMEREKGVAPWRERRNEWTTWWRLGFCCRCFKNYLFLALITHLSQFPSRHWKKRKITSV